MRKWAVIIVLSVYAVSQLCSALLCHYRSAIHSLFYTRQQLRIKNNETETKGLIMSVSDFDKAKREKKEIEINGILYDIASLHISNNKVYLQIVTDEEENNCMKIIDSLAASTDQNQNSTSTKETLIWKWLFKIYSSENKMPVSQLANQPGITYYSIKEIFISTPFINIPGQPPDCKA